MYQTNSENTSHQKKPELSTASVREAATTLDTVTLYRQAEQAMRKMTLDQRREAAFAGLADSVDKRGIVLSAVILENDARVYEDVRAAFAHSNLKLDIDSRKHNLYANDKMMADFESFKAQTASFDHMFGKSNAPHAVASPAIGPIAPPKPQNFNASPTMSPKTNASGLRVETQQSDAKKVDAPPRPPRNLPPTNGLSGTPIPVRQKSTFDQPPKAVTPIGQSTTGGAQKSAITVPTGKQQTGAIVATGKQQTSPGPSSPAINPTANSVLSQNKESVVNSPAEVKSPTIFAKLKRRFQPKGLVKE